MRVSLYTRFSLITDPRTYEYTRPSGSQTNNKNINSKVETNKKRGSRCGGRWSYCQFFVSPQASKIIHSACENRYHFRTLIYRSIALNWFFSYTLINILNRNIFVINSGNIVTNIPILIVTFECKTYLSTTEEWRQIICLN